MPRPALSRPLDSIAWVGALLALATAGALFSRFSIDDTLTRDESIYAYGGQQLADGVPFYVSIFDPKTPLSAMLAGVAVITGRAVGAGDVHSIRIAFFMFACLAVAAMYLLGLWLWGSPLAGAVSAATFASFRVFAVDALGGPDAKTPGVFLAIVSMALLVRRHWFWGAFAGSLAFLVWQPLGIYAAVAVAAALLTSDRDQRWSSVRRALAGAAVPLVAITLYFWLAGALSDFYEAAFHFSLTGVERGPETLGDRLARIARTVNDHPWGVRVLFWGGLVALVALLVLRLARARSDLRLAVKEPYVSIVVASFVPVAVFTMSDFQGYPDLYPALPYAALGVGGVAGLAVGRIEGARLRRVATVASFVAVAALVAFSWSSYSGRQPDETGLVTQRAEASALERVLKPGETLYALGDPTPLVLTGRRSPSRYIYLSSGVSHWVIDHTPGGVEGWRAQIRASDPAIIVMKGWRGRNAHAMRRWLRSSYDPGRVGKWRIFVSPGIRDRVAREGIFLSTSRRPE
jgi:hypothetical protein